MPFDLNGSLQILKDAWNSWNTLNEALKIGDYLQNRNIMTPNSEANRIKLPLTFSQWLHRAGTSGGNRVHFHAHTAVPALPPPRGRPTRHCPSPAQSGTKHRGLLLLAWSNKLLFNFNSSQSKLREVFISRVWTQRWNSWLRFLASGEPACHTGYWYMRFVWHWQADRETPT